MTVIPLQMPAHKTWGGGYFVSFQGFAERPGNDYVECISFLRYECFDLSVFACFRLHSVVRYVGYKSLRLCPTSHMPFSLQFLTSLELD